MKVFRLCKQKFSTDLSGKGARENGGRWNSAGIPLLYTSSSRALCLAEMAVHGALNQMANDYCMLTIELPLKFSQREMSYKDLPEDWRRFPVPFSTQKIGDEFVLSRTDLVFKVPSVLIPEEFNFLLNPLHKDFTKVKIEKGKSFVIDERFF